jgi:tRNA (guanine37-N1)-methyltransferase
MLVNVVTALPELFEGPLRVSIVGRAREKGLVEFRVVDLRDFTDDRHRTVDDYPYGGGGGMVLKPGPFFNAMDAIGARPPIALLSARGRPFRHADAVRYSVSEECTLLCGHYKDIDHRVTERPGVEEISIGEFVLSGGEFAALCVVDAIVRLLPGVLGDHESAAGDSHYDGLLGAPSYTRPPEYRGLRVPDVLLSGDHARIAMWREEQARQLTKERRPDLWERYEDEHERVSEID